MLLNPWVRSDAGLAKTRIKHYYGQHLLEREFWKRLTSGRVDVAHAVASFARNVMSASSNRPRAARGATFQEQMAEGLATFTGPVLLILSGRDLTATEFLEHVQANKVWMDLLGRPNLSRHDLPDADHTFSSERSRQEIEVRTLEWLSQSFFTASRRSAC